MTETDKKLNWEQACALLGCKKSYFYALLQEGAIPYAKLGKRKGITVNEKDVKKYIQSRIFQIDHT